MEKSCRKCATKASEMLVNNLKQSLYAINSFKNKTF